MNFKFYDNLNFEKIKRGKQLYRQKQALQNVFDVEEIIIVQKEYPAIHQKLAFKKEDTRDNSFAGLMVFSRGKADSEGVFYPGETCSF